MIASGSEAGSSADLHAAAHRLIAYEDHTATQLVAGRTPLRLRLVPGARGPRVARAPSAMSDPTVGAVVYSPADACFHLVWFSPERPVSELPGGCP